MRMARRGEAVSATHAPDVRVAPMDKQLARGEDASLNSFLQAIAEGAGYGSPVAPIKPELLVPDDASRIWSGAVRPLVVQPKCLRGHFLKSSLAQTRPQVCRFRLIFAFSLMARSSPWYGRRIRCNRWWRLEQWKALPRSSVFWNSRTNVVVPIYAIQRIHEPARSLLMSETKTPVLPRRNSCSRFLGEVRGLDGLAMVRSIAGHVIDLSGSPIESYFNHAMTLPPRLAGFSMRKPLANRQLVVEDDVAKLLIHDSLRPDFQSGRGVSTCSQNTLVKTDMQIEPPARKTRIACSITPVPHTPLSCSCSMT